MGQNGLAPVSVLAARSSVRVLHGHPRAKAESQGVTELLQSEVRQGLVGLSSLVPVKHPVAQVPMGSFCRTLIS